MNASKSHGLKIVSLNVTPRLTPIYVELRQEQSAHLEDIHK